MPLGDVFSNEEDRKKLVTYLQERTKLVESERSDFIQRTEKRRRQRLAAPEETVKNFPWEKASNVVVPVAQTRTNSISAAMKSTFSQIHPFFSLNAMNPAYQKNADALSDYIDILVESKFHLNLRELSNDIHYDVTSLGTQFVVVPWIHDIYKFKRKLSDGRIEDVSVTRHKGPSINPVRIEDFYTESHVTDLQNAPWLAIKYNLFEHELRQRESQGIYENIDEVLENSTGLDDNRLNDNKRMGFDSANARVFEIMEYYVFWDIDGDGVPEDVKIWMEKNSGVVIKEELNDLGVRNVERIPFVTVPHQLYGVGVGQMCEHMQEGSDACFNMSVNASHISSLQMYITKRGSGIGPKEKFYPLKQIEADVPREDFIPVAFPNTTVPNLQLMQIMNEYTDRVTGSSSAMMGLPDNYAKTRATASGTMFLAQQGSRLFDAVAENVKEGWAKIGMLILFQLVKHKDEVDLSIVAPEKAQLIREILNLRVEEIHLNFAFSITTTELQQTEEAKRQARLTLAQLYQMYGQNVLRLVQGQIQMLLQVGGPQMAAPLIQRFVQFSDQLLVGSTKFMEDTLEDMKNEKQGYLPNVRDIEMNLEMINAMKEMQMFGGMYGQSQNGGGALQFTGGGGQNTGGSMGGPQVQESPPQPDQSGEGARTGNS